MLKDPKINYYFYDFEDEENEFQFICDIFNLKSVQLTNSNANIIKEIAEDFGIDCIFDIIDNFIENNQKVSDIIDNKSNKMESIEDLFDLLYNIKEKTVDVVAQLIKDSKWSKTEDNEIELAAYIFQVIKSKYQLQDYIIELMIQLNDNNMKIIVPFIKKHSMSLLIHEKFNLIYPFIYKMYKKGIITSEELKEKLKLKSSSRNLIFISWFLPELIELGSDFEYMKYIFKYRQFENTLLFYCENQDRIDEYKQMRDKGEYDDEMATADRKSVV